MAKREKKNLNESLIRLEQKMGAYNNHTKLEHRIT